MSTDHILDRLDADLGPASDLRHHVLRRNGNTLLDIPITAPESGRPWAATLWPNPDGTWQRSLWTARPRGYEPVAVHYGDVIEFGADTTRQEVRWYGHLTDVTDDAIILTGPYPTPEDARLAARDALTHWQASQLQAHQHRRRATPAPVAPSAKPLHGRAAAQRSVAPWVMPPKPT